jgi:hypothetical protein
MNFYHKHHIIPRHMGGNDDPSNIVEVTVEEHAALHKQLWEDLGHWQDHVAWKMLSGQISHQEAIKLSQSLGAKNRKKRFGQENHFYGRKHNQETIDRISEKKMGTEPWNKNLSGNSNPQSRLWEITEPSGKTFIIKGLTSFCDKHGLYYQAMGQVAKGKLKQHKGYSCKEIQ